MTVGGSITAHITMMLLLVFYVQYPDIGNEKAQIQHLVLYWFFVLMHTYMIVSLILKRSMYMLFQRSVNVAMVDAYCLYLMWIFVCSNYLFEGRLKLAKANDEDKEQTIAQLWKARYEGVPEDDIA